MSTEPTPQLISPLAQAVFVSGSVLALLAVVLLIRRNRLELRYSLLWVLAGVGCVGVSAYPRGIALLAEALGIGFAFNLLFPLVMAFQLAITFILTIVVSRLRRDLARLAYEVARLKLQAGEPTARVGDGGPE